MNSTPTPQRWKNLWQATALVWSSARCWTFLQGLLVVVQGLLPVASLYLTRQVVNAISQFVAQTPGDRNPLPLLLLLPWMGSIVVVGWAVRAFSSIVTEAQTEAVSDFVQGALQKKSAEVDLAYFETATWHDQMRLAHGEAMTRPMSIVRNLTQLGNGVLVLGAVIAVLGWSQGVLLPVLLLAAVPGALARIYNSRKAHAWRVERMPTERKAGYLHALVTSFPYAKEVRLLGTAEEWRRRFREVRTGLRESRLALGRRRAGIEVAANGVTALVVLFGFGIIYWRLSGSTMTLGDLALLYGAFQRGRSAFSGLLGSLGALYEDTLFVGYFYDFLALPQQVKSPAVPRTMSQARAHGFRLENVSFRYPGRERDALHDLTMDICAGDHIVFVGENGSGKTTLVKLLCRLYDPTAGRILLDGVDIRELALEDLRSRFSVLFQDYGRYLMTAQDNVRAGDLRVPEGDPRIAEALRRGGAEAVIEQLPQGLETQLGRMFKGGVEISVGQWQRIALARAFLRDAPIMMLDEPTSALDAKAERELLQSVIEGCRGKTTITVSHRLTTVKAASRIYMLGAGQLLESGTHAELLACQGAYSALFALHSR